MNLLRQKLFFPARPRIIQGRAGNKTYYLRGVAKSKYLGINKFKVEGYTCQGSSNESMINVYIRDNNLSHNILGAINEHGYFTWDGQYKISPGPISFWDLWLHGQGNDCGGTCPVGYSFATNFKW